MKKVLFALLIIGLSGSAVAEVVHVDSTGFVLENRFEVTHSAEQIWRALVNDVDAWWPKDHSWFGPDARFSIDARAGGCFCEYSGENQVEHMRIAVVVPGKLLRMRGALGPLQEMGMHGTLDWRIKDAGERRVVSVKNIVNGIAPDGLDKLAEVVDQVERQQLGSLVEYLKAAR